MGSTDTAMTPEVKERVGTAIGRMATGVYVVTIEDADGKDGMLATWVMQAAFSPPTVTVAVNVEREFLPRVKKNSKVTISILAKTNNDIFKNFAKPYQEGMDRFAGLNLLKDHAGPPAFADCIAYIDANVAHMVDAGDHKIMVCHITDGRAMNKDLEPMVHLRNNGFQY